MSKEEILEKRKGILVQVEAVEKELERIRGMKASPEREAALSKLEDKIKILKTEAEELEKEANKQN